MGAVSFLIAETGVRNKTSASTFLQEDEKATEFKVSKKLVQIDTGGGAAALVHRSEMCSDVV